MQRWPANQDPRIHQQAPSRSAPMFEASTPTRIYIWEPREGEVLLLKREPDNIEDKFAVAVIKREQIVGHVPKAL